MKFALLLVALPLSGCLSLAVGGGVHMGVGPLIRGTGKPIVEIRQAQAVTSVVASGGMQVTIVAGSVPQLTIEAQKEILPQIKSTFAGGRLTLITEGLMSTDGKMRVRITMPNVHDVEANGATTIDVSNLSGSAGKVTATGASKITGAGRLASLDLTLTGASEADLKLVKVGDAKVDVAGASKAWVSASEALTASASGASAVNYFGKPKNLVSEATGASSISQG